MENVFYMVMEATQLMGQYQLYSESASANLAVQGGYLIQHNDTAQEEATGSIWGTGYDDDHTFEFDGSSFLDPGGSHTNTEHTQENENAQQAVNNGFNNSGNELQGMTQGVTTALSQTSKAASSNQQFSTSALSVLQTAISFLQQQLA